MDARTKITKARIALQRESPFFSYLVMYLDPIESRHVETAAVDPKGRLYYNPDFINSLSMEQIKGVLCHEVLHVAFEHFARLGGRNRKKFNIACDLVINDILVTNGFGLPQNALIPTNHIYKIGDTVITDLDKKTAEQVYNELPNGVSAVGFDTHIYGEPGGGDNNKSASKKTGRKETNWKQVLAEAAAFARQQGKLPAGIARYIDNLLSPKLNWREILYRFITNQIICDYTYTRPHKKSVVTGFYMPDTVKEGLDIVVAIDTSSSIDDRELAQFLSETYSIVKSFPNVRMTLITCDDEIHDTIEVTNGMPDVEVHGGGGTDFRPVFEWIRENKPNTRLVVYLTDGYGDAPESVDVKTLWVITEGGTDSYVKGKGEIVWLNG